jgi:putative ABC transport system ATP-binding protein
MKTIITVKDLRKVYNEASAAEVRALDGVSLTFRQGEFTAIVGPSGSGKTTLLNLIGGLDTCTGGSIEIDGHDISALSERQMTDFRLHHIGFIFQAYNLIPVLTARENVSFVMELQGRPTAESARRATELLQAVGLEGREDCRPAKLSGGQQQRVAVARALASQPRFILADEPTANLDSHTAGNLLDRMLRLNERENVTFLFSTHDPRVVGKARRVVVLEDGKIVRDESQ